MTTRSKRLFAFLMVTLLALPLLCSRAFAEDSIPTHDFVIKKDLTEHPEWADPANKDAAGNPSYYDYKLFQMFVGKISNIKGNKVLSDVRWGASVPTGTQEFMYAFCGLDGTSGKEKTAQNVADYLASSGEKVFHQILQQLKASNNSSYVGNTLLTEFDKTLQYGTYNGVKGFGVTGLPEGYYFVRNDLIPTDVDESYSDYIVVILDSDLTSDPKSGSLPLSSKEVKDDNDTYPTADDLNRLGTIADHDIGDKITYRLSATLPSGFNQYDKYELTFLDNLCPGLTYNNDAKIYYGRNDNAGTSITLASRDYGETGETDQRFVRGSHLEYTIENLRDDRFAQYNLSTGSPVVIEYTATLNANAVIGVAGNHNEYTVRFSNNPSNTESTTTTPPNTAVVLTYQLVFNKVDESKQPLSGADFDLYKYVMDDKGENGAWVKVTELNAAGNGSGTNFNPRKTKTSNGNADNATFKFVGLDDGDYKLVETETPAGYNSISDAYFTVSAGHVLNSDGSVTLSLSGDKISSYGASADISLASYTEEGKVTGLSAQVVNPSGSKLPVTGGIGTTVFYVVGSVLVVASVVALVVKRRMGASA